MKEKSIKINALVNSIKTLMTILFPLITVSYLSRVLGKAGYGKFNYAYSTVSYFKLIAGLGISTYAIREGAKIRDNRKKEEKFADELFTLNCLSTLIAYLLLFVVLLFTKKLAPYTILILITSIELIFVTLGTDWINSIYEDFLYLMIRYIVVQVVSLLLMFLFVRGENDLIWYAWVFLFSRVAAYIANIFYVRKYVHIKLVFTKKVFHHLVPAMIMFVSGIATTIYVNSDVTLLGIIKGDEAVGIYSVASKIYSGAKEIATAATVVTIPRIAAYIGLNKEKNYNELLTRVLNLLFSLAIPLFTGLFMLSRTALLILGGEEYASGTPSLQVLCIASIFAIMAFFYAHCILVPNSREKYFMIGTFVSALTNFGLNFIFIPYFSHVGAAITTLISEILMMFICRHYAKGFHKCHLLKQTILSTLMISFLIVLICIFVSKFISNIILAAILDILISGIFYVIVMKRMKNEFVWSVFYSMKKKMYK